MNLQICIVLLKFNQTCRVVAKFGMFYLKFVDNLKTFMQIENWFPGISSSLSVGWRVACLIEYVGGVWYTLRVTFSLSFGPNKVLLIYGTIKWPVH